MIDAVIIICMIILKPDELHGRDREWRALSEFATADTQAGLAVVYGRRRQGKTHLLQSLHQAVGGLYWQAVQQTAHQNLESFSTAWTSFVGSGFAVRFESWRDALRAVMEYAAENPTLVTIDEVGYLIDSTPSFPSELQAALSPMGARRSKARFVLCGSAFGQMRKLLDAHAPLRGRAQVDMIVGPFDPREAASFWGLESNPAAAFRLDALVGGTPAYRGLAVDVPKRGDVAAWAKRRLLDPQSALFREGRIVVAEDPGLSDQQLFWSVIGAIAEGKDRRNEIAAALGRSETSMSHPLSVLTEAGWIEAIADPLRDKRTRYQVSEPIVRWWRLIVEPNLHRLTGPSPRPEQVWADSQQLIAARIHAPHLERLSHWWLLAHHEEANLARWPREVSSSVVTVGRERAQLDIVATESTARGATEIVAIGEVKATAQPVGPNALERLDTIAAAVAPHAVRVLVSLNGFTTSLRRTVEKRPDVRLADITSLYGGPLVST
jgi:uncharacterized protein